MKDNKIEFEEFKKAVYEHKLFLNTIHFVELIQRLKDFQDLQEKANHSKNLLRVSHNMQDYQYTGLQPEHEFIGVEEAHKNPKFFAPSMDTQHHIYHDDRRVGLKQLTHNDKYTHIAVIQLLKPDCKFNFTFLILCS